MRRDQAWKNFDLGQELSVSGAFIYNGLRCFHGMKVFDHSDEVFEFLYNISVGLERVLKVTVVLLEHDDATDQEDFERSLITHSHLDLLHRIRQRTQINLSGPHNEFLSLLATFYRSLRYDRFRLETVHDQTKERDALCAFIEKQLDVTLESHPPLLGTVNEPRYKKYIHGIVTKIAAELFKIIKSRSTQLNLYTYELRHGSRAETVFLGGAEIPDEEVLWKELLIFFMNTGSRSGLLDFLRSIDPLEFDPELAIDYLECFQSDAAKAQVIDELEHLYGELDAPGERLELMRVIGDPNVCFDVSEDEPDSSS